MKNQAWHMDLGTYIEICELALKHGKKPGESMQEEFIEVLKKKQDKIKLIGETDKDVDLLTGNLRESGLKILNLKEIERKKENEQ